VGELMPLVLAGYGVSLEGDGRNEHISLAPWLAKIRDPAALVSSTWSELSATRA
jgi:hypothetical protein